MVALLDVFVCTFHFYRYHQGVLLFTALRERVWYIQDCYILKNGTSIRWSKLDNYFRDSTFEDRADIIDLVRPRNFFLLLARQMLFCASSDFDKREQAVRKKYFYMLQLPSTCQIPHYHQKPNQRNSGESSAFHSTRFISIYTKTIFPLLTLLITRATMGEINSTHILSALLQ